MHPASEVPYDNDDEINLTPMLDVVFILLIFFIVTATFVREHGIDLTRPDLSKRQVTEAESILVAINDRDEIRIGRRLIDPRALRANIERLHAENPDAGIVIRADRKSTNNTLVLVMDASRAAGIYELAIAER